MRMRVGSAAAPVGAVAVPVVARKGPTAALMPAAVMAEMAESKAVAVAVLAEAEVQAA